MKKDIYRFLGAVLIAGSIILRRFDILDFVQGFCASLGIVLMIFVHINKPKKQNNNN